MTLLEILVTSSIILVLAVVGATVAIQMRTKAYMAKATEKMRGLGVAMTAYASENNGYLPWEDSTGADEWGPAALPENEEVWYNALPRLMGAQPVGGLGATPDAFYDQSYPLFIDGAGYPGDKRRLKKPFFAMAMNSRLQRKGESEGEVKVRGKLGTVTAPARTVGFFERGLPNDPKSMKAQAGFDGAPKGNPRNFVGRYNDKGLISFVDGHIELPKVSKVLTTDGKIVFPQEDIVWTLDPEDDPN